MGKKIKVVDITPEETTTVSEQVNVEPESVDDIPPVESIKEEPSPTVDVPVETIPEPKPRAKPRKLKKEVVETVPEVQTEPVQEVIQEVETVKEELKSDKVRKVVEQVKCPKCDKMMTQKSLRYTHEQNCKGKVVKTEDTPVKRRDTKKVDPTTSTSKEVETNKKDIYNKLVGKNVNIETSEIDIPEDLKLEVFRSIQRQQERIRKKEENFNRLKLLIA